MHLLPGIQILFLFSFSCFVDSVIVETSLGKLNGDQIGNFHLFKKIPFAKPPLGKLRFQKPQPAETWNGVRNAKDYGPACMSNSSTTKTVQKWVDEDCLHLNIFTSETCLKSKNCAVVIYLHGGNLHYDSAVMFNDTFLLHTYASQEIVFVIPAVRLGIFSHFVVEDQSIAPNNLALFDMLQAMEFAKSDIHNFGGNNKRTTLLGHSYGGTVASMLSFSTKVNTDLSLFQQYISMSSPTNFDTLELQVERTYRFAEHANCLPKNSKFMRKNQKEVYMRDCLKKKSASELLRIQRSLEEAGYPVYGGSVMRGPIFQEVLERDFMDSPNNITSLTGCTKYESLVYDHYRNMGKALGFENYEEVNEKYRSDSKEGKIEFDNVKNATQIMLIQIRTRVNKILKKNIPAYHYEYAYPKHANHTDDLFFIMGVHPFIQDENEIKLGNFYRSMFLNFIKTGNPGNGCDGANLNGSTYFEVNWNETTGERPVMKNNFEQKILDYWTKNMIEFDREVSLLRNIKSRRQPASRVFSAYYSFMSFPQTLFILFIIFSSFATGYIASRTCSIADHDRSLYVRLDGTDYPIKN